jgi:hypothetical protein
MGSLFQSKKRAGFQPGYGETYLIACTPTAEVFDARP